MTITFTTYSYIIVGLGILLGACIYGIIQVICAHMRAKQVKNKYGTCTIEWTTGTIYKVFETKAESIGEALDKLIVKENLMSIGQWNIRKIDWR